MNHKNIKLFSFLFALVLCCLIFVSADDQNSTVNYRVDSSYTWEIHTDINFGRNAGTNTTVNRTATLSDETVAGVRVTENIIGPEATLIISLADSNTFRVVNGSTSLNYIIAKSVDGTALDAGDSVLEVVSGTNTGSQSLYFTLTTSSAAAEVAGIYTGTVTYAAAVQTTVPSVNGDILLYKYNSTTQEYELVDTYTKQTFHIMSDYQSFEDAYADPQSPINILSSYISQGSDHFNHGINKIVFPDDVTQIGDYALGIDAGSLYEGRDPMMYLDEIEFGENLNRIGKFGLSNISSDGNTPTTLGTRLEFKSENIILDDYAMAYAALSTPLSEILLACDSVGDYAFYGQLPADFNYYELNYTITIPENVSYIGHNAFNLDGGDYTCFILIEGPDTIFYNGSIFAGCGIENLYVNNDQILSDLATYFIIDEENPDLLYEFSSSYYLGRYEDIYEITVGSDATVVLNETMLEPYWTNATVTYE